MPTDAFFRFMVGGLIARRLKRGGVMTRPYKRPMVVTFLDVAPAGDEVAYFPDLEKNTRVDGVLMFWHHDVAYVANDSIQFGVRAFGDRPLKGAAPTVASFSVNGRAMSPDASRIDATLGVLYVPLLHLNADADEPVLGLRFVNGCTNARVYLTAFLDVSLVN